LFADFNRNVYKIKHYYQNRKFRQAKSWCRCRRDYGQKYDLRLELETVHSTISDALGLVSVVLAAKNTFHVTMLC